MLKTLKQVMALIKGGAYDCSATAVRDLDDESVEKLQSMEIDGEDSNLAIEVACLFSAVDNVKVTSRLHLKQIMAMIQIESGLEGLHRKGICDRPDLDVYSIFSETAPTHKPKD